jgi:hypothetical protein
MAFQAQNAVIGECYAFPPYWRELFVFLGPLGGKPGFVAWPIVCFSETGPLRSFCKVYFCSDGV